MSRVRFCSVEGCGRVHSSRGLCTAHYGQMRRSGVIRPVDARTTIPEELWATGVTKRQLDYWVRVGYVRPDNALPGSGKRRVWTPEVIEDVRWLVQAARLSLPEIAELLRKHNIVPEAEQAERKSA